MKVISLLFITVLFSLSKIFAQDSVSYDYHPPLKIPLILSSNFGELRANHFHMGLDFKTNNLEGYSIYSIEDGFVSRIKVSTVGYGKVVYIDHPNGITSVYAHCSEFKGEIASLVQKTQEAEQNFEVEIFPGTDVISVKKGDIIALSGNTGGSTGPHLHFELRDTETEQALNPLLYGFDMPDSKAPIIRYVKAYGLTKEGYRIPRSELQKSVIQRGTEYYIADSLFSVPSSYCLADGGIGFAFDAVDYLDGTVNQCGLYGSYLIVDGDTLFGQKINRVPFESSRYVNSHKDYEAFQAASRKFHKSFRTQENDLPIYINNSLGIIKTAPGSTHSIEYIAFDPKGNIARIKFTLKIDQGTELAGVPWQSSDYYLMPKKSFLHYSETCDIEIGPTTVYEPMEINTESICSHIGNAEMPANLEYKIRLEAAAPFDGTHYIRMVTANRSVKALPITYEGSWVVANCRYFGSYTLERDVTAPKILSSGFTIEANVSGAVLNWNISDEASGIKDYDLFIDGKWYLLEYDAKSGKAMFRRPEGFVGLKSVKVVVKDVCGNTKNWEGTLNFL